MNKPAETTDPMHHPTLAIATSGLCCHVEEAVDFTVKVAIRDISAVLAPFTGEDTAFGSILWNRRNGFLNEWELLCFVQERTLAFTGREELVQEGCIYDTNDGLSTHDQGNGNTEHGE